MRSDLGELEPGEEEIAELQLLLARRRDLVTDQSRTITHENKGWSEVAQPGGPPNLG